MLQQGVALILIRLEIYNYFSVGRLDAFKCVVHLPLRFCLSVLIRSNDTRVTSNFIHSH